MSGSGSITPLFWINKKPATIRKGMENGLTLIDGSSLTRISDTWIELIQNHTTQQLTDGNLTRNYIRMNVVDGLINLYVTCDKPIVLGGAGSNPDFGRASPCLAGTADGDADTDIVKYDHSAVAVKDVTSDLLLVEFAKACSVSNNPYSVFVYSYEQHEEPRTLTLAGHCLRYFILFLKTERPDSLIC